MALLDIVLLAATLTTALVSGLLLGFAIVAMPGIGRLDDRGFLRAFQVMDRVIQDAQPAFMALWVGSVVSVLAALVLGVGQLSGALRLVVVAAATGYLLGVQVPTATVNIPLNNQLQTIDVDRASADELRAARAAFEARWNWWNRLRSALGALSSGVFAVVLLLR